MKFGKLISIVLVLAFSCQPNSRGKEQNLPRIAIAGLAIESSTFSPAKTHKEAFRARYDDEVFDYFPFLFAGDTLRKQAEYFPTVKHTPFQEVL